MHSVAEMGDGQPMSRRTSSFYNYEELQKEAEEMRNVERAEDELKKNLMFEEKDISLFQIYCHLAEPIDYFYMVLAIIGSIGAGLAMPIMSYLSTDLFSEVGNTSEYADDPQRLLEKVEHAFDTQIKRFLIIGVVMFIANFLSICFWTLIGSRMCHKLKRNYFMVLLNQEQGWFDANNAFDIFYKSSSSIRAN